MRGCGSDVVDGARMRQACLEAAKRRMSLRKLQLARKSLAKTVARLFRALLIRERITQP